MSNQQAKTSVASINTRDIQYQEDHHNVYPPIDISEEFRIDTKPFINRPYFVEAITWSNQAQYQILPLTCSVLPRDALLSNKSLENAIKLGAYYRSDLFLNISVAGTITHAGLVLAAILPPLFSPLDPSQNYYTLINTALSGPHAFLSANEATSVMLHVPWYCNSDLASLDLSETLSSAPSVDINNVPGNLATLVMIVLQPLAPSEGSSTALDIIVEAFFSSLDILVPSPKYIEYSETPPAGSMRSQGLLSIASEAVDSTTSFIKNTIGDGIDKLREGFFKYTGLHNSNISTIENRRITTQRNFPNITDAPQFFEKLDPFTAVDRIIQRPEFNTKVDEMAIDHIISKKQYVGSFRVGIKDQVGTLLWTRPISPFQGGLFAGELQISNNIELMHFLSRGWRGTINIHIQSVMNNKQQVKLRLLQLYNPSVNIASSYPIYRTILNAPSHLMEFTAGGELQTISLPYLCRNNITPCMRDTSSESLFHGQYYIYVAQPLANSAGSPESIDFNIYISLEKDFKFYGYSTELASLQPNLPSPSSKFISQTLDVMNQPQDQQPILDSRLQSVPDELYQERLYSPVDIRSYIRRMYKVETFPTPINKVQLINIDDYVSEFIFPDRKVTPLQIISNMYYGKHIGLKIKVKNTSSPNLTVRYIPPNYFIDKKTSSILNCKPSLSSSLLFESAQYGTFPFPVQELPVLSHFSVNSSTNCYEFIIPNNTFYKYIGSINKLQSSFSLLSNSGLGWVILVGEQSESVEGISVVYAGASDETRLGHHAMAPLFKPSHTDNLLDTSYTGNFNDGPNVQPSTIRNKFLYFSKVV